MRKAVVGKKIFASILMLSMIVILSGCAALMEQAYVDPTKTVGQSVYTGFDQIDTECSDEEVVAGGGIVCDKAKLVKGEKNWNVFMDKVNEKVPGSIRVKHKIDNGDIIYRDLYYNGSKFRMIISLDPEKYDYTYDYLYDLSGRKNKKCRQSRIVFLSNTKDASFEDIIGSIGVRFVDKKIDYQLVFRNQ